MAGYDDEEGGHEIGEVGRRSQVGQVALDQGLHTTRPGVSDMGDLANALKCYSRATLCLNMIKVCVYMTNWSHVLSYVNKVEGSIDVTEVIVRLYRDFADASFISSYGFPRTKKTWPC